MFTIPGPSSPPRQPPSKRPTPSPLDAPVKSLFVPQKKKRKQKHSLPEPFSPADVVWNDVRNFLSPEYVRERLEKGDEWDAPAGLVMREEVVLRVGRFTVSGESLSLYQQDNDQKWAIVTPFAHPGDLARVRIYKHDRLHSLADLVEILEYDETYRGGEGDRRKHPSQGCKYFGECGGCQLQPIPYDLQLRHKRRTVELAYQRFSGLGEEMVPEVRETIGSPKQWGYRTKITPHFDAPPKWARRAAIRTTVNGAGNEEDAVNEEVGEDGEGRRKWETRIGFERKGRPGVMDIEECPIATPVLNAKLIEERARVQSTIMSFQRGATLLLRDSLPGPSLPFSASTAIPPDDQHIAITNHREPIYERVGDNLFSFAAGSFFQNNNSILVPLTEYVRSAIFPPDSILQRPTRLVDTYCGSGLFGITLSREFEKVAGVEISSDSIKAAERNAEMNGLTGKTRWLCGKAEDIFAGLPEAGFGGEQSCVVVDPPRKGCDEPFLEQLLAFRPITVVYVSCNVHTQARDIGWLVSESQRRGDGGWKYELESLRGFDLFPQTAHVESVAVLRLSTE